MPYTPRKQDPPTADVDLIAWLKEEMSDQLDYEYCEIFLGPALFGNGTDEPGWETHRAANGRWAVRAAPGHVPAELKGVAGYGVIFQSQAMRLQPNKDGGS